jgi:hypothetical protein
MVENVQIQFKEEEKVKILIQEYTTLRNELLTRTNNLFQLLGIGLGGGLGGVLIVLSKDVQPPLWSWLLALLCWIFVFLFFFLRIGSDIRRAAWRVRKLEKDINRRSGETLLIWETLYGGESPNRVRNKDIDFSE